MAREGAAVAIDEKQQRYEGKGCILHIVAWMRELTGERGIGDATRKEEDGKNGCEARSAVDEPRKDQMGCAEGAEDRPADLRNHVGCGDRDQSRQFYQARLF